MPDTSPRLALPYLLPSQAQKHVTHNEALQLLDVVVQLTVQALDAITPPGAPEIGDTHGLGIGATGAWAGQDGMLASWDGTSWRFVAPLEGWRAWDVSAGQLRIMSGGSWTLPVGETQNLEGVGINATSDATARLAVSAPETLLTHEGADHRLKLNKAAPGDTGSLLFQTGWSGRAEVGLTGSDDLSFKTSADGSTWNTSMALRHSDGMVEIAEAEIGGGLFLGGTAAINRLGHYEADKFNPMLIDMSGNSVSLAPKMIPYVRVGKLVIVFFNFLSNLDTTGLVPTDDVAVTLPFACGEHSFSSVEVKEAVNLPGPFHWYAPSGQAYALIRSIPSNSRLKVNDLTSGVSDIVGGTLAINLA